MIYGYARVSTEEQDLTRQVEQLKQHVDDERNIIIDKQSGKDFDRRGYNMLTGTDTTAPLLRCGDTLVICSLDRLGRNYDLIKREWAKITEQLQCNIQVLDMPSLNTNSNNSLESKLISNIVLELLSYVADKERKSMLARQKQGIQAMDIDEDGKKISRKHNKGAYGRPNTKYPTQWEITYKQWKNGDITAKKAYTELNLSSATFYRLVKAYENNNGDIKKAEKYRNNIYGKTRKGE